MPHRAGSWRRRPLPANWDTVLRPAVLKRDGYACQWRMGAAICGQAANQCDHVDPDGPDEMWNLQALCPFHHKIKSSAEGGAGWGKVRRAMAAAKHRPQPRHPGLI